MAKCNMRKCRLCKEYIDTNKEDYILYKSRVYHPYCFKHEQRGKKRDKLSEEQIEILTSQLLQESKQNQIKISNRLKLTDWIYDHYNVCNLPNFFFCKLDSVYNGEYKGLIKGIPPEMLLDMWQRKANYLDKVYYDNQCKGKNMQPYQRILYDLAILVNKYDSYLGWLEKQKIYEAEIIERNERVYIDYKRLGQTKYNTNDAKINEILDEI